jgi:hypothetical protein
VNCLKIKALCFSETLLFICHTKTHCHNPECHNMNIHWHEIFSAYGLYPPISFCWFVCHAVMVTIECEQVSCDVEYLSHIKKRSEVLTVVARCSFLESSDISRNPLSLFRNTLTVPSYAEQTNLHHWNFPATNSRGCYHDWNYMSCTSLPVENLRMCQKIDPDLP